MAKEKGVTMKYLLIITILFIAFLGFGLDESKISKTSRDMPAAITATAGTRPAVLPKVQDLVRASATASPVGNGGGEDKLQPSVAAPSATASLADRLRDNIVYYLIRPASNRTDACGSLGLVPIISYRMRSGDRLQDVQVALNMLFGLKNRTYLGYYNALWDTDLSIGSYQYIKSKDYMIIDFAGYLPAGQLSDCDKHGIRDQIWGTFFHYGIKEKTFKINGVFLIDQLNRKTRP